MVMVAFPAFFAVTLKPVTLLAFLVIFTVATDFLLTRTVTYFFLISLIFFRFDSFFKVKVNFLPAVMVFFAALSVLFAEEAIVFWKRVP